MELARDLKLSEDQKREVQRDIRKNTDAAISRGRKLEDELGVPDTGANRMVLRLWESLGSDVMIRNCPYSGQRIRAGMLFDGSCDVDHILPFSRTLDDGFANRILCLKEYNRQKANKTPWEAWGGSAHWNTIAANLKNLPPEKAWRFGPDAMERFEGERDFTARALTDTQYLSRIARRYLEALYDGGDGKSHVWVVPGKLTEMLRRHWGLNGLLSDGKAAVKAKNRTDHRHHAIDAAVVAATDRSLIQRISTMASRDELSGAEDVARSVPPPWDGFRADIQTQLTGIIVSHRTDHGRVDPAARGSGKDSTSGQLHNDTAYGLAGDGAVVSRKPLLSLKPNDLVEEAQGATIRDADLRRHLARVTRGLEGKPFEQALSDFAASQTLPDGRRNPYFGIRRVRLQENLAVIEISDKSGRPYKGYKPDSNSRYELWRLPDGALTHHVISTFDAHQDQATRPHPAARRIMTLHKGDLVHLDDSKFGQVIATVEKFDGNGRLELVPHNEANASDRYRRNKEDLYIRLNPNTLKKANARRVIIDEIGRLRDPGPRF